jgi:hypothetical protein
LAGVTAIEVITGEATVRTLDPVTDPDVAMMLVVPAVKPTAKPAALTVPILGADEPHATEALRSLVVLSLYVPVAANCCVSPLATEALDGVTASAIKMAVVTLNWADPLVVPEVAVIALVPLLKPDAKPDELIEATAVDDDFHATKLVRFLVLESE